MKFSKDFALILKLVIYQSQEVDRSYQYSIVAGIECAIEYAIDSQLHLSHTSLFKSHFSIAESIEFGWRLSSVWPQVISIDNIIFELWMLLDNNGLALSLRISVPNRNCRSTVL